jgi:hypothetical protein
MLKSLLIAIRRKPKVVREQVALWSAGLFTLLIVGFWAFNLPSRFSDDPNVQSAGIFSSLRDELESNEVDLDSVREDLTELVSTTTESGGNGLEFTPTTIERRVPLNPAAEATETGRPIRLATTTIEGESGSTSR